jgi:hypothetical protein
METPLREYAGALQSALCFGITDSNSFSSYKSRPVVFNWSSYSLQANPLDS